jgi:HK97 gp10 family phage protein
MSMTRINLKEKWNGEIIKTKGKSCIKESIYKIGLIVEGKAKELAARRYGYLAASINTQFQGGGTELESPQKYARATPPKGHDIKTFRKIQKPESDTVVLVGTAVDYGPYQEFGTVRMDAQPFLRPAADLAQGKILEIVEIESKKHFLGYLREHEAYVQSRGL